MIFGQQHFQYLIPVVRASLPKGGDGKPYRAVGVLPAVFAFALAVAAYIADTALIGGLGRAKELYDGVFSVDEFA